jgi:hypothetical protein
LLLSVELMTIMTTTTTPTTMKEMMPHFAAGFWHFPHATQHMSGVYAPRDIMHAPQSAVYS